MIRLDTTTRKLQALLGGAITTNQLPITVCYSDKTSTAYTGGTTVINTNNTTAVDICAAPAASTVRDIDTINVNNADTVAATITIRFNDNGTTYTLFKATLATGDQLTYVHGVGWNVIDSTGKTKVGAGVNGPSSSTDNALVRWDGTAGTAIQNSGWTLSDTDALNGVSGSVGAPSLTLNGETTSGLYRIGANNHGWAISGAKVLDIASTGLSVTGTLSATSTFNTTGTGPHAVGGATASPYQLLQTGSFTGAAGGTVGYSLQSALTVAANGVGYGFSIESLTLNKAGSGTHADFASMYLTPPTIGAGAATLTNASTLKITGAPTGASNNYALWVDAGKSRFDSNLWINQNADGYQDSNSLSIEPDSGSYIVVNHVTGSSSGNLYCAFGYGGGGIGSITQNGTTAVAYNTTSDYRLKSNVRPADAASFKNIQFRDFEWVDGRHDCGVIAHELQAIYPSLVVGEKDAVDENGNPIYQQINYTGLIARIGTVTQQLIARIEALESQLQ